MHLHPAISHAPPLLIALALVSEILAFIYPKKNWRSYALQTLLFAAILSPLSYFTGYLASESADKSFQIANELISSHQASAKLMLFALFATLSFRFAESHAEHKKPFRITYSLLLCLAMLIAINTGYRGGSLVFEYGAGVSARSSLGQP